MYAGRHYIGEFQGKRDIELQKKVPDNGITK